MHPLGIILSLLQERVVKSWRTSAIGGGIGLLVYSYVTSTLETAGCDISKLGLETWIVGLGPLLAGLFGIDKSLAKKMPKE